jgi:YHS domain-containing protein
MVRVSTWAGALILALALLTVIVPPLARAKDKGADETITCAVCGKQVKQSKAIRVVKDGHVYYVCSDACREKLMKKKKG